MAFAFHSIALTSRSRKEPSNHAISELPVFRLNYAKLLGKSPSLESSHDRDLLPTIAMACSFLGECCSHRSSPSHSTDGSTSNCYAQNKELRQRRRRDHHRNSQEESTSNNELPSSAHCQAKENLLLSVSAL